MIFRLTLTIACLGVATAQAEEVNRMLFDFAGADAGGMWQPVNDGVMGGRSEGRFKIPAGDRCQLSNDGPNLTVYWESRDFRRPPACRDRALREGQGLHRMGSESPAR